MPRIERETEAPPVNEDGPHVQVYDPRFPMIVDGFYKFKDTEKEGDYLRLPCGKVIVKQCRKHNGGRKLYCVHRKENSKCRWCKSLGLGGGTSFCPCGTRRELCAKHKGTTCGIAKKSMQRISCTTTGGGKAATGSKFQRAGDPPKTRKSKAAKKKAVARYKNFSSDEEDVDKDAGSDEEEEDEWDSDAQSVSDDDVEMRGDSASEKEEEEEEEEKKEEDDDDKEQVVRDSRGRVLSDYELERKKTIDRNQAVMALLDKKYSKGNIPKQEKKERGPRKQRVKTRFIQRRDTTTVVESYASASKSRSRRKVRAGARGQTFGACGVSESESDPDDYVEFSAAKQSASDMKDTPSEDEH